RRRHGGRRPLLGERSVPLHDGLLPARRRRDHHALRRHCRTPSTLLASGRIRRVVMTHRLLVLDNYDSFTFNLVQMFRHYELAIGVVRSDKIDVAEVRRRDPDYIVISPGPKAPASAGISVEVIR